MDAEPTGQMKDEKVHAVLARSTFASQNVKITTRLDFLGSRLVEMSKKCATIRLQFDVDEVHLVAAGSTFGSQPCQKLGFCAAFDCDLMAIR